MRGRQHSATLRLCGKQTQGQCKMIKVIQGDITTLAVDAIVNAANERMLGGGGVDGAIHEAAGEELCKACLKVPEVRPGIRCPTGEARITPGFKLPAKYVIHTAASKHHLVGGIDDGIHRQRRDVALDYLDHFAKPLLVF